MDLKTRWSRVRNVTTSVDLMNEIAHSAGWEVLRWHPGDVPTVEPRGGGALRAFGQSVCVLGPSTSAA
jgi:hypothetical protein